ncbi:MAG: BamA/TamA family outer membrane protein, partial [Acidobacteriota bacterium]
PSRARTYLRRLAILLALVAAFCAATGGWFLGTEAGKSSVLEFVSGKILEASGWEVGARALEVDVARGALELRGVRAGSPGGPPVAEVESVEVAFAWGDLLQAPRRIRELRVAGAVLNASAPVPSAPEKPADPEASGDLGVEVEAFELQGLEIREGPGSGWLERWELSGAALSGSLIAEALVLRLEGARARLVRSADQAALDIDLEGLLRGPVGGPWSVDQVRVSGDAVSASLGATVGPAADQPFVLSFQLDLDPALLAPEIARGSGRVQGQGRLDLRAGVLDLDAGALDFPIAVLEPFVAAETLDAAFGRADALDFEADLEAFPLEGGEAARASLRGSAELTLRRGSRRVLRARLEAPGGSGPAAQGLAARAFAEVLPDPPGGGAGGEGGALVFRTDLRAPGLESLDQLELLGGRLSLDSEDAAALLADLAGVWPILEPAAERAPEGPLEVRAEVSGAARDPRIAGSARWRPAGLARNAAGSRAEITIDGRLLSQAAPARLALKLDSLDLGAASALAAAGPPASGSVSGDLEVQLERSRGLATVRGELALEGPLSRAAPSSAGDAGELLAAASSAALTVDLEIDGLRAAADLEKATARGSLDLRAEEPAGARWAARYLRAAVSLEGVPLAGDAWPVGLSLDAQGEGLEVAGVEVAGQESQGDAESVAIFETVGLQARSAGDGLMVVDRLGGEVRLAAVPGAGLVPFTASARVAAAFPERLLREADLELRFGDPQTSAEGPQARSTVRLAGGVLRSDLTGLELPGLVEGGRGSLELPLAADLPALAALPVGTRSAGPTVLELEMGLLDLAGLGPWLGLEAPPEVSGSGRVELRLDDPSDLPSAVGRLEIDRAELRLAGQEVFVEEPVRLALAERRAVLEPATARVGDRELSLSAAADLEPEWRLADPPADLVRDFEANLDGALEGAVLAPYLAGGRADGLFRIDARAAGSPRRFTAEASIGDAGGALLLWDRPYVTQLTQPAFELLWDGETLRIESGEALLNDGALRLEGSVGEQIALSGELDGVRYRLDYGLIVEAGGSFSYTSDPAPGKLTADLVVQRGSLRRQIDAAGELLGALLAPPVLEASDGGVTPFSETELQIGLTTRDGIRVKNNVADLRVSWSPIRIEGTVAEPRVIGTVETEPDGRVYAYGQVIRLDRAGLIFTGEPGVPGTLDLQVTTSLEDPSLATPQDRRVLADLAPETDEYRGLGDGERSQRAQGDLASGFTTYVGNQLASRVGRVLGRTQLRYQPLWIFGEADPEARLVVSRDLSRFVSLGVAFDLREADEQTYLLELGNLSRLPSLKSTVFSDDEARLGATVEQQLLLGRRDRDEDSALPRLGEVRASCGGCLEIYREEVLREARRAVSWREGERLDPDALFDIEIDVEEALQEEGFTEADASIERLERGRDVDLEIAINSGPRAEFVWLGEKPPRSRRRTLRSLYRSDYSERAALEELRVTAERVWRSRGHPWPDVLVEADVLEEPAGARRVTVTSTPGERLKLGSPIFEGVPAEVAAELETRFISLQSRAELVSGQGGADGRLQTALGALGYPEARLMARSYEVETRRPVLTLEAGRRREIAAVRFVGLPAGREAPDEDSAGLRAGDPLISENLARASFQVEQELRQAGWVDATARVVLVPLTGPDDGFLGGVRSGTWDPIVELRVEPGVRQRLRGLEVEGTEVTKDRWVARLSGIDEGSWIQSGEVSAARRRLLETRLFHRVQLEVETSPSGDAVLRFDLEERPRYLMSYGLRWEESEGFGAMFDLLDRNSGGRGIGLGLRAQWVENSETSLRLYGQLPRVFNSRLRLELFVEGFEENEESLESRGFEVSAQLGYPLGEGSELRSYFRLRRADVRDELRGGLETRESVPLLGLQWLADRRDDPLDPSRGFFASVDLSGSEDVVSGDDSHVRLFAQGDAFLPLGRSGRWTWAQGLRLGAAEVFSGALDRDVRFFAGGARSVRGYRARSLGPQDPEVDRALGGEALMVLHEELRYRVSDEIQAVLFMDVGNVWDSAEDLGRDLLTGVGLGVRYRSPIGLLRLDFAHPLDGRLEDEDFEVYFGLGQAF